MGENVTRLEPVAGKPDKELAAEFRERVIKAYEPIIQLCNEMDRAGFELQVQTGKGPLGHSIMVLKITKAY